VIFLHEANDHTTYLPAESGQDSVPSGLKSDIESTFIRSCLSIFRERKTISQLFFCLVKKLGGLIDISKAVLAVSSSFDRSLKIVAAKGHRGSREGLAITLPKKNSLMYSVFFDKSIFVANELPPSVANFIERRILLDGRISSILIYPINHNDKTRGLFCLTSENGDDLTMFADGCLDCVMDRFGEKIDQEIKRTAI